MFLSLVKLDLPVTRAALPIMRQQKSGYIQATSSRYRQSAAAWPCPAARPTMPPNGLWGHSPSPSPRKWLPLASRCVRSNPAECGQTGALVRTKTRLTLSSGGRRWGASPYWLSWLRYGRADQFLRRDGASGAPGLVRRLARQPGACPADLTNLRNGVKEHCR